MLPSPVFLFAARREVCLDVLVPQMESPERRRGALDRVRQRHRANPRAWLLANADRFSVGEWLVPDNVDPHFEAVPATRWPKGLRATDNDTMVLAMLASWVVRVPWSMPEIRATVPRATGDNEEEIHAVHKRLKAGLLIQLRDWYSLLFQTYEKSDAARNETFAVQFRERFHSARSIAVTASVNKPRLWFAQIRDNPVLLLSDEDDEVADLRAINADRHEVAIKAQPFPANMQEVVAIIKGARATIRDGDPHVLAIDTETPLLYTSDVLFGLLFRDLLLNEPVTVTPHLAVALDAFVGFGVRVPKGEHELAPTASRSLWMYQVSERGDFTIGGLGLGQAVDAGGVAIPGSVDAMRSLMWQALFSVYVLARKHGIHHGDAHPGNILGRRLTPLSPLYNRPWVYVLPTLHEARGSTPRYFVLPPEMHQNLFCMLIDFDATRFLPAGPASNYRDLRWNMQRVLYGHKLGMSDDYVNGPFYNPLAVRDPVFFFDAQESVYAKFGYVKNPAVLQQMVADTIALSDASFDLDNWPVLLGTSRACTVRVADEAQLAQRFPDAIAVAALTQYPNVSNPAGDDTSSSPGDAPKRARDFDSDDDDDAVEPPVKRPRFRSCSVCGAADASVAPCTGFCEAVAGGRLTMARPLRMKGTMPRRQ